MNARTILLVIATLGAVACKPSPEKIELSSSTHSVERDGELSMAEGDVMVVEAKPLDDDNDAMNLCVTAESSDPAVLTVQHVVNKCRSFVVAAKAPGRAKVTFHARDDDSGFVVAVTPAP